MKRVLSLLLLFTSFVFSQDIYTPKSDSEKKYLETLRKTIINVGLENGDYTSEVIDGESLNLIIEDMLRNYLQLNIQVTNGNWDKIYSGFKKGEIDSIGFITKSRKRNEEAEFSIPLLKESLYAASKKKRLTNYDDLKDQDIYIPRNSIYGNFFSDYLDSRNLKATKILVDNTKNFEDEIVLESSFDIIDFNYTLELVQLPDTSFAILKKYEKLIPIINNAIKERYREKIENFLKKRKNYIFRQKFLPILTSEEKRYLEGIDTIKVAYENMSEYSYYSEKTKTHRGVLPDLVTTLGDRMGITIKEDVGDKGQWNKNLSNFNSEKIDIIPISKNKEREGQYLFTKDILKLPLYEITCLEPRSESKIGVLANSIDELIAKKYYLESEIISYDDHSSMIKDFEKHKVISIISLDLDGLESLDYGLDVMEYIPINLAVKKKDKTLRDILDKGISKMFDKEDIIESSELERKIYLKEGIEKSHRKYQSILILLTILVGASLILFYRTIKMKKEKEELLKDPLTGLLSRATYDAFCKTKNDKEGVAILIDLNNFKQMNDEYGHEFGDVVLSEIGKVLKDIFLEDYIFRISGDEFYIFSFTEDIKEKIEKLERTVSRSLFLRKYSVNLSLGYYKKKLDKTIKEAFKYADLAMYKAKREKVFSKEVTDEFIKEIKKIEKIKKLLTENLEKEIYSVFQPKFNLKTGELVGGEALARWENSELGFISPGEFIPVAEELKIIHRVDYKIAEETIKNISKWKNIRELPDGFRLSFNFSAGTMKRDDVVEMVKMLLKKYGVSGKYIEIEITESLLLDNAEKVIERLNSLKALEIKISIDDFTAGHSTAGLLSILPVDIVKFDRSLILGFNDNEEKGKKIYKGLIKMIKSLELKIVAEGIETQSELNFLKDNEVDYAQGFLLGRPVKESEFFKTNSI